MATKNIVPRADGEGEIGTTSKHWQKGFFDEITIGDGIAEGKIILGSFGSPVDVTATRKYGAELHYSGNDYDVVGLRSRASLVTTDTTATAQGAEIQAANNDGIDAGVLNGAVIEAIGKSSSTAATITMMRGALVGSEWNAKDTVTSLRTLHIRTHTRNAATEGYISGTGYLLYLENEAVGGNGQVLDAGIYFKETNLSGGNKAFTHGIDFSGGTYQSSQIKFAEGELIYDDGTNSELYIQAPNDAAREGITIDLLETNQRFRIRQNSKVISMYHDGTDAYYRTSIGEFIFMTDEGVNTITRLSAMGKGNEFGSLRAYDQDNAEYIQFYCTNGVGVFQTGGVAPSQLQIMRGVAQDVLFWSNILAGNPNIEINGYITAGAARRYGRFRMDDTNDEFIIEAENNANHEGITLLMEEANQKFRIRDTAGIQIEMYTGGIIDLVGQTITTINAAGTADLTDWLDRIGAADADDCKYAVLFKVAGIDYYLPCFTSV